MPLKEKSEKAKQNDAFRQAILDQFNKVPCPSRNDALEAVRKLKLKPAKNMVRDFDRWWNQFLTGNLSLKQTKYKRVKAVELDEGDRSESDKEMETDEPKQVESFDPEQADETTGDEKTCAEDTHQQLVSKLRYDPDNPLPTTKTLKPGFLIKFIAQTKEKFGYEFGHLAYVHRLENVWIVEGSPRKGRRRDL